MIRALLVLLLMTSGAHAQTTLGLGSPTGTGGQTIPVTNATNSAATVTSGVPNSIAGMTNGTSWNGNGLTYSMPGTTDCPTSGNPCNLNVFDATINARQDPSAYFQSAVRWAFAQWAAVTGLVFTEVTESASVRANIMVIQSGGGFGGGVNGQCYYPGSLGALSLAGICTINNADGIWTTGSVFPGQLRFTTPMHEIGHALGLKHPDEISPVQLNSTIDGRPNTAMSQRRCVGCAVGSGTSTAYQMSIGILDFNAIAWYQPIPGATPFRITTPANQVYSWSETTGMFRINGVDQFPATPASNLINQTVCDTSGTGKFLLSNYTTNQNIDIRPSGPYPPTVGGQPSPGVPSVGWSTFDSAQLAFTSANSSFLPGNVVVCAAQDAFIKDVTTGSGDDTIYANANPNAAIYDGGTGTDTVVLPTAFANWFVVGGASTCAFFDTVTGQNRVLVNIESVQFSDTTKALDSACVLS